MGKTKRYKILVWAILALTLMSALVMVKPASAQSNQSPLETIFIQPDGSVYPQTAPIQQNGNNYTFTDNIYAAIKIQKSNIVLNGAGHTLSGPYNGSSSDMWVLGQGTGPAQILQYTIGVDLANGSVNGVTIENLNIMNFSIGMYIWTQNNLVIGNGVSDNIVGVLVSGSNATITKNYISNNEEGLFFGFNTPGEIPSDIIVCQNSFEHNTIQLRGCTCKSFNASETPHNWDNGKVGNYWSDYNGTDSNHDGIGDTPYIMDVVDKDSFPLMQSPAQLPVPAQSPVPTSKILVVPIALAVSAPLVVVAVAFVVWQKRKRKLP